MLSSDLHAWLCPIYARLKADTKFGHIVCLKRGGGRLLMQVGGAEVSQKHANFIVAHEGCMADDVLRLVKIIQEKVFDRNQIHLETEVQIW